MPLRLARVVVDVRPLHRPLDYAIPEGTEVRVGSLVRVPLRGRSVRAWVVELPRPEDAEVPVAGLRPLRRVLTPVPVLSERTRDLACWAAHDTLGHVATVLDWATPRPLPRGLRRTPALPLALTAPALPRALHEAVAAGHPVRAFVRNHPADDGAGVVTELGGLLPPGRTALVVSPPGQAPAVPGAVVLSGAEGAARTRAWEAAVAGGCRVVVGGRRAPLVPVPGVGLVVVTREHPPVHKDERTPALDARVLARRLAAAAGVPFVATGPSSPVGREGVLAAAAAGGHRVLDCTADGAASRWPLVEIADLTEEPPGSGLLGERLFAGVRAAAARGGRSLLFLNRRGTARSLVCRACGRTATCEVCAGFLRPVPAGLRCDAGCTEHAFVACPSCGSHTVRALGIGVERMARELAAALPGIPVLRAEGTPPPPPPPGGVVVGTQAALGRLAAYDFVALVDPDALLGRPGLLTEETAFHTLLDAVAAARPRPHGRVLVQTRVPGHPGVAALARRDAGVFERHTLAARRRAGLPPYTRLLQASTPDPDVAAALGKALDAAGATVFGPREARMHEVLAVVTDWDGARDAVLGVTSTTDVRVRLVADPLDV